MRAYTVATVALMLGLTQKQLDNILTRFAIRGVVQSRQGVSRRLGREAVLTLQLANELVRTLGLPLGKAIAVAERAGKDVGITSIALSPSVSLTFDMEAASREVGAKLALAVEVTPVPKRGRPSTK